MIRIMAKNKMMVVDGNDKCQGCHEPIAAAVGLDALLLDRLETAATDCKKNYLKKNSCDAITQIKMIMMIKETKMIMMIMMIRETKMIMMIEKIMMNKVTTAASGAAASNAALASQLRS